MSIAMRFILLLLLSCPAIAQTVAPLAPPGIDAARFPPAARPVASIISDRWRAEDERERVGEAARVIEWMGIRPGTAVADIGAGAGYYTVRLADAVGPAGRVYAQDVMPDYLARLRQRIDREHRGNVSVSLGDAGDPRLPSGSLDAALLIHMYHEIQQPFALLANLVPALRAGARVGVLDVDDIPERHGTPRALLACEMQAVGYRQVAFHWLLEAPPRSEYLAVFEPGPVPQPGAIRACATP